LAQTLTTYRDPEILHQGPFGLVDGKDGSLRFIKSMRIAWKVMSIQPVAEADSKYVVQHGIEYTTVSMQLEPYNTPGKDEAYILRYQARVDKPIQVDLYVRPPPNASDKPSSRTMPINGAASTDSLLRLPQGPSEEQLTQLRLWQPPIASDEPSSRTMPMNGAASTDSFLRLAQGPSEEQLTQLRLWPPGK
jgi:hypothetical protein